MHPIAEQLRLPTGYGRPSKLLAWETVRRRLEEAEHYWLATTRPDGRPHIVPVDGVWVDDIWYFGGADETVHQRNLMHDPRVAVHLPDTIAAVIVEGTARWRRPSDEEAGRIAETTRVKYAKYGYPANAEDYAAGVWGLSPAVVLAWERLDVDATRFVFRPASSALPTLPGVMADHAGLALDKVAWICIVDRRLLVARSRGRDIFYFPGGRRIPGETDAETLTREVAEELSVAVRPSTMRHFDTYEIRRTDGVARMACYFADYQGTPQPDHEIAELAWITAADRDRVSPLDQLVLDDLTSSGLVD